MRHSWVHGYSVVGPQLQELGQLLVGVSGAQIDQLLHWTNLVSLLLLAVQQLL